MSGFGSWNYGGGSSSHYGAPYEPEDPTEYAGEEATPDVPAGVYELDAPYLNLDNAQELEVYSRLKDRVFEHTTLYDTDLLNDIGISDDFNAIWRAVGWESIEPLDEEGSRLLTIQFLCTLDSDNEHIYFRLFGNNYKITWTNLARYIGFNKKCVINLDFALPGFERHSFWEQISGRVETGTFKPTHSQIQHPTLRLMHRWISMTFSQQEK